MSSVNPAEHIELATLNSALVGGDERAAVRALREVADSARARLAVASSTEPEWFDQVAELLLSSPDYFGAEERVECLLSCAQWYQKEGKWASGTGVAEKAIEIAEKTSSFSLLRRAYSLLGNLHNSTKDYVQATVCYTRAVELARAIGDRVGECAAIANLATARFYSGLLEESRTLNSLVIEMATGLATGETRLLPVMAQAHHNIALASFMLGDLFIGRTHIDTAIEQSPEPKSQWEAYQRVIIEYTYVKLLSKADEFENAREHASLARSYAEMANSPPANLQATLAESTCDLNEGRFDIALSRMVKLLDLARDNEPARRDVLEALVLGHEKAGHVEEAKRLHAEYLHALAQSQRTSAARQLEGLKRAFRHPTQGLELDHSLLPSQVRERLVNPEATLWENFRVKLEAMAVLAELRDDATGEHAFRVGRLSGLIAAEIGYSRPEVSEIELAARLHDIGKLIVPDVILQKRGRLVDVEVEVMRRHTTEGAAILTDAHQQAFRQASQIALHHHEWWDGRGYPRGINGALIPEQARITALADVFDALSHRRPYKPAWPFHRCIETIRELRGRQFEPRLCDLFLELIQDLYGQHRGELDAFLAADAKRSPIVTANKVIDRVLQEYRGIRI